MQNAAEEAMTLDNMSSSLSKNIKCSYKLSEKWFQCTMYKSITCLRYNTVNGEYKAPIWYHESWELFSILNVLNGVSVTCKTFRSHPNHIGLSIVLPIKMQTALIFYQLLFWFKRSSYALRIQKHRATFNIEHWTNQMYCRNLEYRNRCSTVICTM